MDTSNENQGYPGMGNFQADSENQQPRVEKYVDVADKQDFGTPQNPQGMHNMQNPPEHMQDLSAVLGTLPYEYNIINRLAAGWVSISTIVMCIISIFRKHHLQCTDGTEVPLNAAFPAFIGAIMLIILSYYMFLDLLISRGRNLRLSVPTIYKAVLDSVLSRSILYIFIGVLQMLILAPHIGWGLGIFILGCCYLVYYMYLAVTE